MNSKNHATIWLIGLILIVSGGGGDLKAQIGLDTTYAAPGARPFDQPVDPDRYLIRPGERLDVVFLGSKLADLRFTVNSEGRLVHRELGQYDLAGRTLAEARTILLEPLRRLYNADEIVISVNAIYTVAITVSGRVKRPGTYLGYTSQRVSEMIDSAGGVAPGGSARRIRFEGGPVDIAVDLDSYRYASDKRHNPCLYSGHRVTVPPRTRAEVQVTGALVTPRAIELLTGESVADMVRLAGGLLPDADLDAAYLVNATDRSLTPSTPVQAGDVLVIPDASDHGSALHVKLFGIVSRPGLYEFSEGLTLAELLRSAGGSGSEANSDRITVFRQPERDGLGRRPEGRYPLMPMAADHLTLRPGDSVYVPRRFGYVSLTGLVDRVGLVPYTEGHSVEDYVRMAGGYSGSADPMTLEIFDRVSGLTRAATMRSAVYDGDQIIVRQGDRD